MIIINCWWKSGEENYIVVYTEDLKLVKKIQPGTMATYMQSKDRKVFGCHFKLEVNSKDYKKVFKELGLSKKDEYKGNYKKTKLKK